MSLFYAAGYTCHVRMRLTRTGEALLAIAGALVPLGVWVVGGAEGIGWSRDHLLLAASCIALPVRLKLGRVASANAGGGFGS
jgi:hypothetical protein